MLISKDSNNKIISKTSCVFDFFISAETPFSWRTSKEADNLTVTLSIKCLFYKGNRIMKWIFVCSHDRAVKVVIENDLNSFSFHKIAKKTKI